MARPDYVPRTHAGFKSWQQTVAQFVSTNATAWNIDSQTVTDLNTQSTDFLALYDHVDNRATRTLQQVTAFNQFRISYTSFLRELVQGSLVNNKLIPYDVKIAMGLNPRTGARPERPAITSLPVIEITSYGGGLMEFICKDNTDGRTKRPVNADGIKLNISINMGKASSTSSDDPTPSDIIQELVITNSKTRVRHTFTGDQRGKQMTVKGRWYNNTDSSKDGNYGNSVTDYIS